METLRVRDTSRFPTAGSANWFLAFRYMAKRHVWRVGGGRRGTRVLLPRCTATFCVRLCSCKREREREEERKREEKRDATRTQRVSRSSERQTGRVKKGTVRTPKGLRERAGRAVGGKGSYKIQFQGCRFNTRHTAQIFHLLSTFRRYVGIRRNGRLCNGCARCKWPGM